MSTKKRVMRGLLSLAILVGVAMAVSPFAQNFYTAWNQRQLKADWQEGAVSRAASTRTGAQGEKTAPRKAPGTKKSSGAAAQLAGGAPQKVGGAPFPKTRLTMPDIGVDAVVVSGIDEESLRRGPGHFPGTALPGQSGNCVIAGHRNVYGSWFLKLDSLFPGQSIYLETPDEKYEYRVVRVFLHADTDTSLLQPPSPDADGKVPAQLTLITCTVPRTTNRLILIAQRPTESEY